MKREDIEELRERVSCGTVVERAGFAIDLKESTRRAVKYRRSAEIIIVTHEGRGWFDPLSDAKGDVFALVEHLEHVGFLESVAKVADLVGFAVAEPQWQSPGHGREDGVSPQDRWRVRRRPWFGSATWRYLHDERCLPASVISTAIQRNVLREGPYGSVWAAHSDDAGGVTGWEARGPQYRGFASGGTKVLFRLGPQSAMRLAVTEAAIDAMSLAAIEGLRDSTLYLSTGGGWSPTTEGALRAVAARSGVQIVAATDANSQGDLYADRLRTLAEYLGCDWMRLRPPAEDWNETLKLRGTEKRERREIGVPHTRRPRQGRLRPAEPALDTDGRDAGGTEEVMKD